MMCRNVRGFMSLFHSDKPVVCKVHGFCVAGGTDMALCSDLLVIEDVARSVIRLRVYGACRRRRSGLIVSGSNGRNASSSRATASPARKRWSGGLRRCAPRAELDARFENLLERIARMPVNQLVMMKLLVNQTVTAMGLAHDADPRHGVRRHCPPYARGLRLPAPGRGGWLQGGCPRT